MKKNLSVFIISFSVILLDQFTKWVVKVNVPFLSRTEVFPGLDITHLRNPGIAFGILRDMPSEIMFYFYIFVLVAVTAVVAFFLQKIDEKHKVPRYALACILGGAIGNSIDRFLCGYVTDFIAVYWPPNPDALWPPFNVADSAITVGTISMMIALFTGPRWEESKCLPE